MNKTSLIILLISLSISLAEKCHPSCVCDAGSNECKSCVYPLLSTMDSYNRSCKCNQGYYQSSLSPFQCTLSLDVTGNNQPPATVNPCLIAFGTLTGNISIETDCYIETNPVTDAHTVYSQFNLLFNSDSEMDSTCKAQYSSVPYYLPTGKDPMNDDFIPLDSNYWSVNPSKYGGAQLKWSLIEAYNHANTVSTTSDPNQFNHVILIQMNIMANSNIYRYHHYNVIVYTNRNQVQTFNIDVDIQRTQDCTGECKIIADLDVTGQICTDSTCDTQKVPDSNGKYGYVVGDTFYAKIWFKDPTYTKHLKFNRLYYMNSSNQVSDLSTLVVNKWEKEALIISLPLIEPSASNQIQVQMLIDPNSRLRYLQSSGSSQSDSISKTFQFKVEGAQLSTQATTSSATLLFGILNLLAIILFI